MLTLSALKSHLVERRSASLDELALRFDADRETVRDALGRLEARGRVARLAATARCGGCSGHGCHASEIWVWRDGACPAAPGCRDL